MTHSDGHAGFGSPSFGDHDPDEYDAPAEVECIHCGEAETELDEAGFCEACNDQFDQLT